MSQIILTENFFPDDTQLVESVDAEKNYWLNGIMMQGNVVNGNRRVYDPTELNKVVQESMQKIQSGFPIMGELNHPSDLAINPYNVSHIITEMRMNGNDVVGKMKLLKTPAGDIARAIMEGGGRLGVSSRGTGSVDGNGKVTGFSFVTVDIVSQPSAPNAHPNLVREALENQKIMTLAEAVQHDAEAQKYLRLEIKKFMRGILGK
jgi:hypothetical protein